MKNYLKKKKLKNSLNKNNLKTLNENSLQKKKHQKINIYYKGKIKKLINS